MTAIDIGLSPLPVHALLTRAAQAIDRDESSSLSPLSLSSPDACMHGIAASPCTQLVDNQACPGGGTSSSGLC